MQTPVKFYLSGVDILDPFYSCKIHIEGCVFFDCKEGISFPTVEHAFQWFKFWNTESQQDAELYQIRSAILHATTPNEAKRIAADNCDFRRPNWDDEKLGIMEKLCVIKFNQSSDVRKVCASLLDHEIIEASPDPFWGSGEDCNGQNELGKIWTRIIADMSQRLSKEFRS